MTAPASLRVLLTNNALADRAGSELYVRDVAIALVRAGHRPVVYSTRLGDVAAEVRAATVPVVSDLNLVAEPPDLIHGHHHLDTMTALLHFGETPAVAYCHGWLPWEEAPLRFPRIRRYVAVDEACRDRLTCEHGIPPEIVRTLLNFVDLARFPRRDALPARPGRALVFSNQADETGFVPVIRQACGELGIAVDVLGRACGRVSADPGRELIGYDLVFAKARAALEAMAAGCAVVLGDSGGCGPLVTSKAMDELREQNFGLRTLSQPWSVEGVRERIGAFDPTDAGRVTDRIRDEADVEKAIAELIGLYHEVVEEHRAAPPADWAAERRAAAAYFRWLAPRLKAH